MANRVIRVTGKGEITARPDMTKLTIQLKGQFDHYNEAVDKSVQDIAELKSLLAPLGFAREDIKTVSLSINTSYEHVQVGDHYEQRFVGYKYGHVLKLEFGIDNELLGKILYTLMESDLKPALEISYMAKDETALKNQLLANAVSDSKVKADILAKSAGVKLGEILSVDYSWGQVNFEVKSAESDGDYFYDTLYMLNSRKAIDIEPDDIQVSDTVTVVWSIL